MWTDGPSHPVHDSITKLLAALPSGHSWVIDIDRVSSELHPRRLLHASGSWKADGFLEFYETVTEADPLVLEADFGILALEFHVFFMQFRLQCFNLLFIFCEM